MNTADWLNLVQQEAWETLEEHWLSAVERWPDEEDVMLAVLEALLKQGQGDRASTLASTWLSEVRGKASGDECLRLAREMVLNSAGGDEIRSDVAEAYRRVYADRPGLEPLIRASGLLGGKTPRRALRTLDVCLALEPGAYLISRSDDAPAEVMTVDLAAGRITLRGPGGTHDLDPDQLANRYNPAEATDFRVLTALHPERFTTLLADDPAAVVIGVLRAKGGTIDSDDLKYTLTPRYLPAGEWSAWWSRARTALKRHRNVRVEGRSPVTLTYDEVGRGLDEEVREQWDKARTAEERVAVVDSYLREAKSRKHPVDKTLLTDWARAMTVNVERHKAHPAEALRSAIVVERLRQTGHVPANGPSPVTEVFSTITDPVETLMDFATSNLVDYVLDAAQAAWPDRWPELFLQMLPKCPSGLCDHLADHLVRAGHRDGLQAMIRQMSSLPLENLKGLAWLWSGPRNVDGFELPSRVEVLTRMLTLLSDLARHEDTPADVLKDARATVRSALTARKMSAFREALTGISPELASTVQRQVSRTPGLSAALVHDLTAITRELFPSLFERPKLPPWDDPNVLYTTEQGRKKAEDELNFLVNVKMPENARAIGEAASHGDLSENSEYKFALEERDLLRARVALMQSELAIARVIEPHIVPRDCIGVGSKVVLRTPDGSATKEMTFLGPWDADVDRHVYNYKAPMSQKLMGLRLGDTVELPADDQTREYRIEHVESAV